MQGSNGGWTRDSALSKERSAMRGQDGEWKDKFKTQRHQRAAGDGEQKQ